jgi:hypothetical protein
MEKEEKKLFNSIKTATVLSGIGMGLLLGLIMGLSVSEVVKVIMGALTGLLGIFLGFDKRSFSGMTSEEYQKDKLNTLLTALRAGSFGLAVVGGILFGMWIRTNEVFSISQERLVKQWTDAGYDSSYARKLVTFQLLGINPGTGELGAITEVQRAHSSNLFSAEQAENFCSTIDPDRWNNDWKIAKEQISALNNASLTSLMISIEENVPEGRRFDILYGLRFLVCTIKENKNTEFCQFGTDISKWQGNEGTSRIASEIAKLPAENQNKLMKILAELVCQLEKD